MGRLNEYHEETQQKVSMLVSREQSMIEGVQEDRKGGGWFNKLKTKMTGADPFQIEINKSEQAISTMDHMQKTLLKEAKDILKKPAEEITMENINNAKDRLERVRKVIANLGKIDGDKEHWEINDQAIDAVRDLSIGVTTAPLAFVGAPASAGIAGAAKFGALQAARMEGMASAARGTDDIRSGKKTAYEATRDATKDTAKAAAFGAALGGIFAGAGKGIGKAAEKIRMRGKGAQQAPTGKPSGAEKAPTGKTSGAEKAKTEPKQSSGADDAAKNKPKAEADTGHGAKGTEKANAGRKGAPFEDLPPDMKFKTGEKVRVRRTGGKMEADWTVVNFNMEKGVYRVGREENGRVVLKNITPDDLWSLNKNRGTAGNTKGTEKANADPKSKSRSEKQNGHHKTNEGKDYTEKSKASRNEKINQQRRARNTNSNAKDIYGENWYEKIPTKGKPSQGFVNASYDTLGIDRGATLETAKTAYKNLARKYHPDKHSGIDAATAAEKFKEISVSFGILNKTLAA